MGGADAVHTSEHPLAGMSCRELVELVTAYFDGALPADVRAAFEAHLKDCADCAAYLEQMRITILLAHHTQALEHQPEITALLAEFRGWKTRHAL